MVDVIADVLVVDDHPMMRRALMQLLELEDDLNPIAEASSGRQAISMAQELQPDLIMMDLNMPEMDGIETIKRLRDVKCDSRILVFTVSDDQLDVQRTLKSGADGYLLKEVNPQDLYNGIVETLNGGAAMNPSIALKTLKLLRSSAKAEGDFVPEEINLTAREIEVLEQLSKGLSYSIIAQNLFLSPYTVRKHIENIYGKLQVHSKLEPIQKAQKNKLI